MGMIQSENVVEIIRKTLSLVDSRLVHHGERVAYIVYKMLQCGANCNPQLMYELCLTAILHDIGAYKTDEIDRMVEFETKNVWQHSVYGYLFLKKFSFLGHVADAVLFHHLSYEKLSKIESPNKSHAMLFSLADRLDVYCVCNGFSDKKAALSACGGVHFSPEAQDLLAKADKQYHILDHLEDGSYLDEILDYIRQHVFSNSEIEKCLKMLVYIIDFRSEITVTHTIMTMGISCEIARVLKMDEEKMNQVYYGSLLHDLGKISTPLSILENPGRLTSEEMFIMKQHVSITEDILTGYVDDEICKIAVRHHEKLDGSGYPHGLKANDLTQAQRLLAVADIISALAGRRSYKEGYEKSKVIDILRALSADGKVCGEIVELFVENYDEIMQNMLNDNKEIMQVYKNFKEEYVNLYEKCMNL